MRLERVHMVCGGFFLLKRIFRTKGRHNCDEGYQPPRRFPMEILVGWLTALLRNYAILPSSIYRYKIII